MSRPLPRLRALTAAGAVVALAATAACGGGDSNENEIVWWHIQNEDPEMSYWQNLSEEWLEESGTDVAFDITPIENDAFKQRLSVAESADEMPDLFQTWGGGVLAEQAEAGLVRDLTDELSDCIDEFNPGYLENYTVDGRLYGVPFDAGAVGFWYNMDLFAEAGIDSPPETWSEFLTAVEDLKAAGITPISIGQGELWPGHFYWTYLVMRTIGLEALSESAAEMDFSDPGFVTAGEHLADLVELEPFQSGFTAAPYGEGADASAAVMGRGEAAMELMGQWAPGVQATSSGTDGLGDSLGFFPFPAVEGGQGDTTEILSGGNGFAVGNNAPDEVFDFLCHMFSEEGQRDMLAGTDNFNPVAADVEAVIDEVDPHLQLVLDVVAESTGSQLYLDQDYPAAVGETVNEAVGGIFLGDLSPEEVVEEINTAWERER